MSKSHEHDASPQRVPDPSRDAEVGDSGTGTPGATDKVTRGGGEPRVPPPGAQRRGPSRDGEVGSGGGGTPPATDPPARGGY